MLYRGKSKWAMPQEAITPPIQEAVASPSRSSFVKEEH